MKLRDLLRHLNTHGCKLEREGARHSIYSNPARNKTASVPRHKEIKNPTARKICEQLEIPTPRAS